MKKKTVVGRRCETCDSSGHTTIQHAAAQAAVITDRAGTIEAILRAARRREDAVVARVEHLCADGKWRGVFGMPQGMATTGETRVYYVLQAADGTTYGDRGATADVVRERQRAFAARQEAEFRAALEAMPDERVASQAACWLKF